MEHRFVNYMPDYLDEKIIYISIRSNVVVHLCVCGCKNKVVTPIAPIQWSYSYNGESVSLSPSIGNWNFDCKSHYWIRENKIVWAESWEESRIKYVQESEKKEIENHFEVKPEKLSFFLRLLNYIR